MKELANIEELKWSVVSDDVNFKSNSNIKEIYEARKKIKNITQYLWITKQPVIDKYYNVFNPQTLILIHLN
jgi:hypothetical protein